MNAAGEENLLKSLDYSVLQQCMHCGMCLPTCPTYVETGRERNSPRGRIALMRAVADGDLDVSREFAREMDYCVGCLACQTACPAGVDYSHLLETARAEAERSGANRSWRRSFYRWLTMRVLFPRPWLLRLAGRMLAIYQQPAIRETVRRLGLLRLAPKHLRHQEPKAPVIEPPFSFARILPVESPRGETRHRVGLLIGCVQDLAYARINRATADVLLHNGCEVITPRAQVCCGSLHAHNGDLEMARRLARRNLDSMPLDRLDAVISNAGGCGSHLRRYAELLHDDPEYAARAADWDRKLRDIHEWLIEIGFDPPNGEASPRLVAYDESCHLAHGQRVRSQPRAVLGAVPGVELVELTEADWCCGSAGIYSLTQPATAQKLLDRKLNHVETSGAEVLATANPGCLLQLANGCRGRESLERVRVVHPIELLAEGYARDSASPPTPIT